MTQRCKFDMPVDGLTERYWTMEELMRAFHRCKTGDPAMAHRIIKYACDSNHAPAKLAYSQFLRRSAQLNMTQQERYKKAEMLLVELVTSMGVPNAVVRDAAVELSQLYDVELRRPFGAVAMYLCARRFGAPQDPHRTGKWRKQIARVPIDALTCNNMDLFRLGQELLLTNTAVEKAIWMLREAITGFGQDGTAKSALFAAQAHLILGDYCGSARHYIAAREEGFPEYLDVSHKPQRKAGTQAG